MMGTGDKLHEALEQAGIEPPAVDAAAEPTTGAAASAPVARRGRRRWWRRGKVKRGFIWTHRWTSLVLGLGLVIVTTTGVPLLYQQEIVRHQHADAYRASGPATLSFAQALSIAQQHDASFAPQSIYRTHGVYVAENFESGRRVTLDPSNGRILGDFNAQHDPGAVTWTMSLLTNIHDCMLSCEEYVGYQSWLEASVPGTKWLGFEGESVSWGGLILGILGLLLVFLALSGIWLWWPGVKRWATGVRVRMRKGRYARDYDLHQVAGMIAVPLLLLWAITAMGYEFGFVEKGWYLAVPGKAGVERTLESKKSTAPDIGVPAAIAATQRVARTSSSPTEVDVPAAKEATATYGVWFQDGFDPWGKSDYAGDLLVSVDRHDGTARVTYGGPAPVAQALWNDWNFPTHSGRIVGPWWRLIWAVLGTAPLLLAVTGLSTWLYKRGRRKRRRSLATA